MATAYAIHLLRDDRNCTYAYPCTRARTHLLVLKQFMTSRIKCDRQTHIFGRPLGIFWGVNAKMPKYDTMHVMFDLS